MIQIDKEAEIQKTKSEKRKVVIEQINLIQIKDEEEESSYSLMSMYNLDSNRENPYVPSHGSPIVILPDAPLPMHLEEVHSSPVMEKVPFERNLVIQEEDHPSSYNIEEIFGAFTLNLCRKEGRKEGREFEV